jgi:hypothetical protein
MRGSNALNILAKVCRSEWGAKLYAKTLIRQIGLSLYKDRTDLERSLRSQKGPGGQASPFQNTPANGFQYGFKIRVSVWVWVWGAVWGAVSGGRAAGSCWCWGLRCCGMQWLLLGAATAAWYVVQAPWALLRVALHHGYAILPDATAGVSAG